MTCHHVRSDAQGFSLAEVLVATSILATGLAALAQLFALAAATNLNARGGTAAVVFAEQKIEQIRSQAWVAITDGEGVEYLDNRGGIVADAAGATYVRRWTLEQRSNYAAITIRVGRAGDVRVFERRDRTAGVVQLSAIRAKAAP